jgi:23S rRNA G2445 N2-methylase RlmL
MRLVAVARCLPGLEQLLIQELEGVGITPLVVNSMKKRSNQYNTAIATDHKALGGVISFPTTQAELFRCHAQLGIPTSILLHCTSSASDPTNTAFTAKGLAELRRKVSKMPIWNDLLVVAPDNGKENPLSMSIHVTSYKSKLYHTQAVAERIEQGIYDALSLGPVSPNEQDGVSSHHHDERRPIHIRVTIVRDRVHILLDTSSFGLPLHQRGGSCSLYA